MNNLLVTLQRSLVTYRKRIIFLFLLIEVGLMGTWLGSVWMISQSEDYFPVILEMGGKFGQVAAILFLITLIPGILKRIGLFPLISVIITPFRRHLGITTFLLAFIHQSYTAGLPFFFLGIPYLGHASRIYGLIGFTILFPVWLTSNDTSMKLLGKNWKRLQRLTYVAMIFIFGHVAFVNKTIAIPVAVVILAEIYSWFVFWKRKQSKAAQNVKIEN